MDSPSLPANDLRDAALSYAARGWHVVPLETAINGVCTCWRGRACRSAGKHPMFETGEQHAAATTDPEWVREWWAQWPDANVGIATGRRSGLVVLDVDPAKGGNQSLETLLPSAVPTLSVVTGSGGLHLYYQHPARP